MVLARGKTQESTHVPLTGTPSTMTSQAVDTDNQLAERFIAGLREYHETLLAQFEAANRVQLNPAEGRETLLLRPVTRPRTVPTAEQTCRVPKQLRGQI